MQSHRPDPIRVTLDDIEPGRGRITVECYGRAWASYWGAMGDQGIAQFFASCDNHYLIGNLAPDLHASRYSADALVALARKTIRGRRKGTATCRFEYDPLTKAQAEELMGRIDELADCETEGQCWSKAELLEQIFGPDGTMTAVQATEPNPEYDGLERICNAVREALKQITPAAEET
ncbi:hypothetical protein JC796_03885 [Delftia acidovorans]|uniref:hypothetical protein n=1 Tax=Delftia acidovorans TaxID=80866 RepID=UPI0018E70D61|nr:hypothetical protein [Delftia acidovorans]MBJ2139861.1 hypothetical protein [Delftia acidovorans]